MNEADSKDIISPAPDKSLDDTPRDEEVAMVTGGIGQVDSIADSYPKDDTDGYNNNTEPGSAG